MIYRLFLLLAFIAVSTGSTALYAADSQLTQLLEDADRQNPALLAALEQIAVADSKIAQATSLADPQLTLLFSSYPVDSLKSNEMAMTGTELQLAQRFPFPGKLDAGGKVAEQRRNWFAAAYQDSRLQVRQKVKDAWYRLLLQRESIELTKRNLGLLDDFIRLTEARYEVGAGLQQNVLKAHLQRSRQEDMLIALQQQEVATLAELNSLAGRATDQPIETGEKLSADAQAYDLLTLQQQAEQNRPMFGAYAALLEQYHAQKRLAELDYNPDFNLFAGYRWRDDALNDGGVDFVSAGISINLPVRRERRGAAVAEADSLLRLAARQRNEFRSGVELAIHRSLSKLEQAAQLAELYRSGIIPQAEQTLQATLSAYQVDKVGFLDLLDAQITLYRYEIDYLKALSDQQRSRAELEAAAGLDSAAQSSSATDPHKG